MIKLKPYSRDAFIHRPEVDLIQGKFKQFVDSGGRQVPPKAFLFRGERGFGKTWLCFHLHRTILPQFSNLTSLYIALFPLPKEYDIEVGEWVIPLEPKPEETCKDLMVWVCDQLKIPYPNDPTLLEARWALVGGVEAQFTGGKALVLILDSVFEADWDLLETVEQNFLAPLAELSNVFFIMTGRGRPYPWISPALRIGMKEETLKDFPIEKLIEKETPKDSPREQLAERNKKIEKLSSGSPLVSYALLQSDDPVRALDEVAGYLLEVIPPSLERRRVREAFEALCVLNEFREGEMEIMLKAYYEAKKQPMPPNPIREVRDDLLKTYLFRWEGGGFRVDASLRNVLQQYLKHHQPDLWKQLNCAAYKIYLSYAEKYDQYREEYEKLANPFKEALAATGALADCERTIQTVQPA